MQETEVNTQGPIIDDPSPTGNRITEPGSATGRCGACGKATAGKYCDAACYRIWQRSRPVADRFWAKVDKSGPLHPYDSTLGECWVWTGTRTGRDGYGGIYVAHHQAPGAKHPIATYVHRLSWELHYGLIPDGRHVLHNCDNRSCVNPAHLKLGDQAANMKDAASRNRFNVPRPHHANLKLSASDVERIKAMRKAGETLQSIADVFRVTKSCISQIVRGKRRVYTAPQLQQAS